MFGPLVRSPFGRVNDGLLEQQCDTMAHIEDRRQTNRNHTYFTLSRMPHIFLVYFACYVTFFAYEFKPPAKSDTCPTALCGHDPR